MRPPRRFYVYIMILYVGITGDLRRRVWQHKNKLAPGFTSRYNLTQLVYYECFVHPDAAIGREKEIKSWRRSKKLQLIEAMNPHWEDLARDWQNTYKPSAVVGREIPRSA
jgi:putative endonuclease